MRDLQMFIDRLMKSTSADCDDLLTKVANLMQKTIQKTKNVLYARSMQQFCLVIKTFYLVNRHIGSVQDDENID